MNVAVGRIIRIIWCTSLVASVAGCASISHTRYGPAEKSAMGGYAEQKISATQYRVQFAPNAHTPKEKAEDYTLLRAAEITTAAGYRFFEIVSWNRNPTSRRTPVRILYGTGLSTGGETLTYATSEMVIEVSQDRGDRPKYDALALVSELRQKYGLSR